MQYSAEKVSPGKPPLVSQGASWQMPQLTILTTHGELRELQTRLPASLAQGAGLHKVPKYDVTVHEHRCQMGAVGVGMGGKGPIWLQILLVPSVLLGYFGEHEGLWQCLNAPGVQYDISSRLCCVLPCPELSQASQ